VQPARGEPLEDAGVDDSDLSTPVDTSTHPSNGPERRSAEQEWIIACRGEIDDYMLMMRTFNRLSPDEVFRQLSAITARLAELRLFCVRSESRRLAALRSREIDPTIDLCERQFRYISRLHATRQFELDTSNRGQT
jgi:hypothetical protein